MRAIIIVFQQRFGAFRSVRLIEWNTAVGARALRFAMSAVGLAAAQKSMRDIESESYRLSTCERCICITRILASSRPREGERKLCGITRLAHESSSSPSSINPRADQPANPCSTLQTPPLPYSPSLTLIFRRAWIDIHIYSVEFISPRLSSSGNIQAAAAASAAPYIGALCPSVRCCLDSFCFAWLTNVCIYPQST